MTHGEGVNIQVGPVPKGQIRLEGHFCGVATTSSHRLELAIPINEEVDINLLYPLLNGFQASREAKGDFEEASPASPMDPELWKTLEKLLEADRKDLEDEEGEVVEDLLECMGPNWKSMTSGLTGLPGAAGSRRNSLTFQRSSSTESVDELQAKLKDEERELRATKAHERAMEIDFQAKEALVQNLMEERSKLRAKTQELTKQLETNVAERWLCSCFGGFGKLFQKSEDDQLESIAEALEEREEAAVKSELGRASELGEGQVLIEGHFTGQMVTKAHFMEVAMPVGATMPGVPVVEMLRAMCKASGDEEDEGKKKRLEVISEVLSLLEVDVLPEEDLAMEDEEDGGEPSEPPSGNEGARNRINEMSKEIEELRSEQSRIQQEAEQLRLKNSTLATFLASAERSAMQLRSALTEAGIQLSESPTSQGFGQFPSQDQAHNIEALESWAARLRGSPMNKR